ncbi:MAG: ketopantoate reductase family protein [Promethearchaeota archaeon]
MTFNKIIILGAGAIGSAYGALLSRVKHVTLVGREAHMNAIAKNGLTILGDGAGTYTNNIETATEITEIPAETLLIICVKANDLHDSLCAIQPLIRDDTVLLLLQNGLGIKEIARKAVKGRGTIVRGIVGMGSEVLDSGRIIVSLNFTFFDSDEASKQIIQVFQSSGLDVAISDSFLVDLWRKVAINCVTNSLSAILGVYTYQLLSPHLAELRYNIVNECKTVGAAEGVELDFSVLETMEQALPKYKNRTSMLQDIHRGRRTEIEFLNGKIVELGKKHNIPTPVNECLTQLVRFKESVQE